MVCDIIIKPVDASVFDIDSSRLDFLKIASGGDALNAAVNMAKLGLDIGLAGKIGNDILGEYLMNQVTQYGIDARGVKKRMILQLRQVW